MQVNKLRITTAASITAMTISVLAFAVAPVNAVSNPMFHYNNNDDTFKASSYVRTTTENENKVDVDTNTRQYASTGDAEVVHNDDFDGSAGTGSAANEFNGGVSVGIANNSQTEAPSAPELDLSQVDNLDSWDDVSLRSSITTKVENENKVYIDTNTSQTAKSGDATVACNDDITGDVTTGDASNAATTNTTVSITN